MHNLCFKLVFGFGLFLGLYFRVQARFGPELVGPFTTLKQVLGKDNLALTKIIDPETISFEVRLERRFCPYPRKMCGTRGLRKME